MLWFKFLINACLLLLYHILVLVSKNPGNILSPVIHPTTIVIMLTNHVVMFQAMEACAISLFMTQVLCC